MLQGWTLGQNHSVIHAIALYTMGDVHRATIVLARNCRNVGQRETDIRTACPDVLTASSPSPSFPHSPPDLYMVQFFHVTQAASLYSGPVTGARLIEAFLLDRCKSYAVVHE